MRHKLCCRPIPMPLSLSQYLSVPQAHSGSVSLAHTIAEFKYIIQEGARYVLHMQVWKVQPSQTSFCTSQRLIYEVMRKNGSPEHIYPMCGIFYLPSIDTGTRGHQFNISSERHPARIQPMDHGKFGFSARGSYPGFPAQQTSILTTKPTIYDSSTV